MNFRFWNSLLDSDVISLTLLIGCKCVVDVCVDVTLLYSEYSRSPVPDNVFHVFGRTEYHHEQGAGSGLLLCDRWIWHLVLSMYTFSSCLSLSHPHQPCPNCTLCYLSVHNINNPWLCRRISWLSLCMLFEKLCFTGSILKIAETYLISFSNQFYLKEDQSAIDILWNVQLSPKFHCSSSILCCNLDSCGQDGVFQLDLSGWS